MVMNKRPTLRESCVDIHSYVRNVNVSCQQCRTHQRESVTATFPLLHQDVIVEFLCCRNEMPL